MNNYVNFKDVVLNGGGTYVPKYTGSWVFDKVEFNHGYMVSVRDYMQVNMDMFKYLQTSTQDYTLIQLMDLVRLAHNNYIYIYSNLTYYIGLWIDGDVMYIDVSIWICDLKDALECGDFYNQKAIFDCENQTSLRLQDFRIKERLALKESEV